MTGNEESRVTIMIRKGIKYERMRRYELDDVSMCWVKIKCKRRRSFMVGGIYREWQQSASIPGPNSRDLSDQKERLKKIMGEVEEVVKW